MEIKKFKISCHAILDIMGGEVGLTDKQKQTLAEYEPRKQKLAGYKPLTENMEKEYAQLINKRDNPELPQGAKTYCKTWLKQVLTKRKKDWKAIVVEKGLQCELDGIRFISDTFGYVDFEKNDEFFDNEYIQGSPDILHNGKVRDTKLSWDVFTFPMFDTVEDLEPRYRMQVQGYFIITGYREGSVDYVLIDTPMALVQQDLKKLYFQSQKFIFRDIS